MKRPYATIREEPEWDAKAFARARVASGYSWRELSAELGVPTSTLHHLTRGGYPSTALLRKIAALFGVPQKRLKRW